MFRSDLRLSGGVLALTMTLTLAGPAVAAGRPGAAPRRGPSAHALHSPGSVDRLALVLRQVGVVYPLAGLVASWLGEGHILDPNGTPTAVHPNPAPNGSNAAGTTEEGHILDPNG